VDWTVYDWKCYQYSSPFKDLELFGFPQRYVVRYSAWVFGFAAAAL
jgi:hypothetical protein